MPQKGTIAVITLVIVLLIIIAGIGGYYLLGLDPVKQRTPASDLSNSGCTQISEFVIQQKNLTKIASCTEKEFAVNGQKVYFVNIGFGEPMDCPSGCIQASYSAIIENDKVIDFGSLREDFLDIAINTKTSKLCNSKQPNELTLIKDGEQYKWKISFNNEDSRLCQLSGYATVEGGSESFDLTNLKAEVQELDCSNLETLEEICSNIPDIATNCATDENKKEACLYLKGISKGIDCYDRLVAKRKCGEIHCAEPRAPASGDGFFWGLGR